MERKEAHPHFQGTDTLGLLIAEGRLDIWILYPAKISFKSKSKMLLSTNDRWGSSLLKDMHYRNVQKYIYSVRRTVLPNRNFNLHKEIKSVKNEKMRLSVKLYTFFILNHL